MAVEFLSVLAKACDGRPATFETGQSLFRQGDAVRWLYLISEGQVRLSRMLAMGSEIALARVTDGQILAEASVFSPNYHCDAIAERQTKASQYAMSDVRALLRDKPEASLAYGAHLAGEVMDLRAMSEIRAIRRADDRLLAWLQLHARDGTFDGQGAWPSIARQIGLSGESIYRALAALERTGRIKRRGGKTTIC